ncbi:MAG: isocitrate lyase/phosphoenolpyruvate mutase family protein [Leptonema sp. (in: Bacteria)]|nr:isocitrate lyase/phosphoenolpyruvate mutase family protein [Leptonema sp. (in: bacteria)]
MNDRIQKAEDFRKLHQKKNPLILPNIWEPLGALMLQDLGYCAVATSSSAMAYINGLPDGEKVTFDEFVKQLGRISAAVNIPVSADIESGFATDNRQLKSNIEALLKTGIVGINFEDSSKQTGQLLSIEDQVEKIKLIRATANQYNIPLFINARIDTYSKGQHLDKLDETLKRAAAYKKAGADSIFPILIQDIEQIQSLVTQCDLPINVMLLPHSPSLAELKDAGVARISLGSGFLKIGLQAMKRAALQLKDLEGQNEIDQNEISSSYLNRLIAVSKLNR